MGGCWNEGVILKYELDTILYHANSVIVERCTKTVRSVNLEDRINVEK